MEKQNYFPDPQVPLGFDIMSHVNLTRILP